MSAEQRTFVELVPEVFADYGVSSLSDEEIKRVLRGVTRLAYCVRNDFERRDDVPVLEAAAVHLEYAVDALRKAQDVLGGL